METNTPSETPSSGSGGGRSSSPACAAPSAADPHTAVVEIPLDPQPAVAMVAGAISLPILPQHLHIDDLPPPKPDYSAPPPYEVATKLPTYEEVQKEKTRLGEPQINPPTPPRMNAPSLPFLAIHGEEHEGESDSGLLGTDFMFFTAFLVAFLFNWVGFLLLMCFCHTIAARYGALSGFGLSLAKWTLIVKHSTDLASRENSWLWWLIMAFGLLIFVRAIIQYLNIKRGWRLLNGTAQERLLFFY